MGAAGRLGEGQGVACAACSPATRPATLRQPALPACRPSLPVQPALPAGPPLPQIFETLLKIRRRDQSIYEPASKFYSSESEEEEGEDGEADLGGCCRAGCGGVWHACRGGARLLD